MNIEKIVEVLVPPPGPVRKIPAIGPVILGEGHLVLYREDSPKLETKYITVYLAGQAVSLLLPDQDSDVLRYHEVGVTLPVKDPAQLVNMVEVYLKSKKIASKVFAEYVLGVSSSAFSNLKRRTRDSSAGPLSERDLVIWGRGLYYLVNLASSSAPLHPNRLE